ncbi:helix-turn-helix domain-containing protein [Streptomyces sp. NBC_00237]|uniref:GAF domain-containing protein n=1 Tax=Streptomyces sp. NBC_00237 TaxID=2975687 RepID=UPI002254CEC9|nr:GAF domain-containing protein [Streptomyces sp. NBC_00237]MCX5202077.1 helix-turn-helix domain-containing protein [Streptomyces sp. NBC_00237]
MTDVPSPGTPASLPATAIALRELLDLLAAGASAEQLAGPAARARTTGASGVAWLAEATEAALSVRRTLDQHRRREAELAALFDTASDLAALRGLDAVLRAIVRRARTLLGTDVAYLTLNDPAAHDTYMRVTDGSVSATFQQLRLRMGDGLGGLVAQTARPYASQDYRTDHRFRHTGAIDRGVGEEGLRGILGVPLRLGDRVIGVLFAADRAPRDFTPDAIALLASLADHAAVAIDGARLMEETRSALVGLKAANATARAHSEALRRASDAHDRLTELVLRGGEVGEVAAAIAALLDGSLSIHDTDGTELARVGAGPAAPPALGLAESRTSGRAAYHDGAWTCAVLAGSELLGTLVLTGRAGPAGPHEAPVEADAEAARGGPLSDADLRLFERAALVTALLLLLHRSVAETEDRVRGELLDDLLTAAPPGRRGTGSLALRAKRLGVDLAASHAVVVLDCDPPVRSQLVADVARRARTLGGLAGTREGLVVLIAPARPGELARDLAQHLTRTLASPVTVGAAGPATGAEEFPHAHSEARRCLNALHALGRTGDGADLTELGFLGVLLGDRSDVAAYTGRVLGPVQNYDEERGTELIRTLEAYFAHGGSLSRAKDALHVHVNTVTQRLERVGRLLGPDWNSPARALELQLALRLNRLAGGRAGAGENSAPTLPLQGRGELRDQPPRTRTSPGQPRGERLR